MPGNYGGYLRTNPRLRVLRGYPGNEATHLSHAAPVTVGVTILSGQIISLALDAATGLLSWKLGPTVGQTPYFAFHDSTDPDVTASNKLLGLSCAGDYDIQTGWILGLTTPVFAVLTGFTSNIPLYGTAAGLVGLAGVGGIIGYAKVPNQGPSYSGQAATTGVPVANGGLSDLQSGDSIAGTFKSFNSESRVNNGSRVTVLNLITRWNGA